MTDTEIDERLYRIAHKPQSFAEIALAFFEGEDAQDRELFHRFFVICKANLAEFGTKPYLSAICPSPGQTKYYYAPDLVERERRPQNIAIA
jgi:hypothetical protein